MQWLLCVLASVFPPQATSQPQKGSAELARAQVLEQSEHDLKGAVAVYRSVAADAAVEPGLRARASLLLGKLLRQLGEKAEAEAALTAAAAGPGPAAEEAKKILAGQEPDQAVLKERVNRAMAMLRTAPNGGEGFDAFRFIGREAVPLLGQALEQEKVDRGLLQAGVHVLALLGGPEASACIGRLWTSRDTFVRNAVREGLNDGRVRDPDIESFFRAQLKTTDPGDRAAALRAIGHLLSVDELLPLVQEAGNRCRALGFLAGVLGDPTNVEKATPVLVALIESADKTCEQELWDLLTNTRLAASSPGRSLQIRAAGLNGRKFPTSWPQSGLGEAEHGEELVAAARRVGAVTKGRQWSDAQRQILEMVAAMLGSWRSPATPSVLALAQFGYDYHGSLMGLLSRWVADNLNDQSLPAVLDAMPQLTQDELILNELLKRPLPVPAYGPLFSWIEKLREPDNKLTRWMGLAVRVDTKEAQEYLVKRAGLRPGAYEAVGNAFAAEFHRREGRPSARQDGAMVALLRMKAEGPNGVTVVRSVLFGILARDGSQGAAEALPEAYRLGLVHTTWPDNMQFRGLQALAAKVWHPSHNRSVAMTAHGYDTETVTRTVSRCLESGLAAPFEDLVSALWQVPDAYPPPVLAAICERATSCPEAKNSPGLRGRMLTVLLQSRVAAADRAPFDKMILACLQHQDPAFPREMLRGLIGQGDRVGIHALAPQAPADEAVGVIPRLLLHQDHEVVRSAAILLGQLQRKDLADHLIPLLRHAVNLVRLEAVNQLGSLAPERVLDQAAALFRDPDSDVRRAVVALCERKLDRRAVPGLLELLKDPFVSEQAAKALKAIEFYVDQTERWQRLLQGSGLQANTAAEALLKQAGRDQPKDVRLLAIASLGSLGVPETQPFLIECAREPDAELAAAARAALEKIHRASR